MLGVSKVFDVLLMYADKCKACSMFKHLQQQKFAASNFSPKTQQHTGKVVIELNKLWIMILILSR